jgi:hypothetical protein
VLSDFGLYRLIVMGVFIVIDFAMVMLLRDVGPYGTIFMTVSVFILDLPVMLDG